MVRSRDQAYTHLANLVAIPSVSGDELASDQIIMYAGAALEQAGMHVRTFNDGGFASLVATAQPERKHSKLLLAAHLDVVPGAQDQFALRTVDGRFYGRGVLDMKFAAACFLAAAAEVRAQMDELDFGIMLTTDEEVGGVHGVKYLLEQGYRTDICLLPDGANNWLVEAEAKGAWVIEATATGKTAHASRPWQGDSATDKLLHFIARLKEVVPPAKEHADTTMVISQLRAGQAFNQVPDLASATFDLRFRGKHTRQELEHMIQALATANGIKLETKMEARPVELDLSLPALQVWEEIVERVRGQANGDYALSFGASDARFFSEYDIPTIVTYPEGDDLHGDNEWIGEQAFYQFYDCVLAYIKAQAKRTVT